MYTQFFGLRQEPFSIAPDPRYLFMSERHREALAHLLYGVNGGGGFVLLTGEIGAGKTTVCRCFLEQVPKRCHVAYVFNPALSVPELLRTICDEFGVQVTASGSGAATVKDHIDPLTRFLLDTHAVGQNSVLIIDEAQNLSAEVLEQLRLLTNLETAERKLLQIILIGQPELRDMLARPELEQLAQRVIARYHLGALNETETRRYVRHRLSVAGARGAHPFSREAVKRLHELSRGVPRRINLLADRAMLGAYAKGQTPIERDTVDRAADEVFGPGDRDTAPRRRLALVAGLGALGGAAVLGAALWALDVSARRSEPRGAVPVPAAAASAAASAPRAAASAATSAPAAPVAVVDARAWIDALPRDEKVALGDIATVWQLPASAGADPCDAASQRGVLCFRGTASEALLRRLARPVVLSLRDDAGRELFAPLVGLAGDVASVRVGGAVQALPWSSLERQWRGEFATLWRTPPGWEPPVIANASAPAARWVADQLGRLPGASSSEPLRTRVMAFQASQGLVADGLAGPITLMQLNRAAGIDEPRLVETH